MAELYHRDKLRSRSLVQSRLNWTLAFFFLYILSFFFFFKTRLPGDPKKLAQRPRRYHQSLRLVSFEAWSSSSEGSYMQLLRMKRAKITVKTTSIDLLPSHLQKGRILAIEKWCSNDPHFWKYSKGKVMMHQSSAGTVPSAFSGSASSKQCVADSNNIF